MAAVREEACQAQQSADCRYRPHHGETQVLADCSQQNGPRGNARIESRIVGSRGKTALFRLDPINEKRHGRGLSRTEPEPEE